jgi:drug/metabolite transporter (DMT)-like permease
VPPWAADGGAAALFILYLPVLGCRQCFPGVRLPWTRPEGYQLIHQADFEGEDVPARGRRTLPGSAVLAPGRLVRVAAVVGPCWFWANYAYNASLHLTSVASVTILSTTSSVWTLLAGVLTGTEALTVCKVAAVGLNLGAHRLRPRPSGSNPRAVRVRWRGAHCICG